MLYIRQCCAVVVPSPANCDDHHSDRVFKLRQLMQHTSKSVMRVTKSVFCDLRQLIICNARSTHRGSGVVKDNGCGQR